MDIDRAPLSNEERQDAIAIINLLKYDLKEENIIVDPDRIQLNKCLKRISDSDDLKCYSSLLLFVMGHGFDEDITLKDNFSYKLQTIFN
jgi:hypothetical protein